MYILHKNRLRLPLCVCTSQEACRWWTSTTRSYQTMVGTCTGVGSLPIFSEMLFVTTSSPVPVIVASPTGNIPCLLYAAIFLPPRRQYSLDPVRTGGTWRRCVPHTHLLPLTAENKSRHTMRLQITVDSAHYGGYRSTLFRSHSFSQGGHRTTVRIIPLDELQLKQCDLIKIDVQVGTCAIPIRPSSPSSPYPRSLRYIAEDQFV
jgi:hypothetical protein